jgi:hypothetical protein
MRTFRGCFPGLLALLLTACSAGQIQAPPSAPLPVSQRLPAESGKASFFFPLEIPPADLGRRFEAGLPARFGDERRQELTDALREDFYRYTVERGAVEVGFAGERITFAIPIKGKLTLGGRLRPVPLGRGLPVQETVEFSGWVRGTASPTINPDWQPDPHPTAQLELSRADLRVLDVFSVRVVGFLEERLNPVLNQELRQAAARAMADLSLRRKAEAAWRDLHVVRRAIPGENVWLRFQPTQVSLAPIVGKDNVLRTGIGISGRVSLTVGPAAAPLAPSPLPPLAMDGPRSGGFDMEVPVVASPEELSRVADRTLRGFRYRASRSRELVVDGASLGAEGDRVSLTLDFRTEGGTTHAGRVVLRGRPVLDPKTNVLRLADLQYGLEKGDLALRLLDRLHRAELLERLEKGARLDLAPVLGRAEREAARAIQDFLPWSDLSGNGLSGNNKGEVKIDPVEVLGVSVSGGAVWARCRVKGTIPPQELGR